MRRFGIAFFGVAFAGTLSLAVSLAGCASPYSSPPPPPSAPAVGKQGADALITQFDALRLRAHIPGLAVVVIRGSTVELARGLGQADVAHAVPVTPDTPFNIASVTKPLSAVVALRLVERGVLDLDRPMASYDGFKDFCAGARRSGGVFFTDYACDRETLTLRHVLSMTVNGEPGTRFFYNPPSYSWASRPMAQVSGVPFSELMAREVFAPAGMSGAARIHRGLPLPPALADALATPYQLDATGRVLPSDPPPPQGDGAAGGVIASAMDLARFDLALTEGRLLSPASTQTMWSPARSPRGTALPYGLGWFVQTRGRDMLVWHAGLWEGAYSALYLKVPNRQLTLSLLANSDGLRWDHGLDEAAVERSPFAQAFLAAFDA